MEKPQIFFDFDGFVIDSIPLHMEYLNEKYGIKSTIDDYKNHPSLEKLIYKVSKGVVEVSSGQVYEALAHEFLMSKKWHDKMNPVKGIDEVLYVLSNYTLLFQ